MKKYPKIVQCDSRGQIVIPKDLRRELGIEEGTGFYMYSITDEGLLLKKIEPKELSENSELLKELEDKSSKVGISKKNLAASIKKYKRKNKGGLDLI